MNELIKVQDVELPVIEFEGQRVVTLSMVDKVHARADGTAGRNFRENRSRLLEGKHYFKISSDEIRRINPVAIPEALRRSDVIVLAERGYLMLVKSFTDDLAWEVQDKLVEGYFRAQQKVEQFKIPQTYAEALRLAADQALLLEQQKPAVEFVGRYVDAKQSQCISDVAKIIGWKQGEFFDQLDEDRIIFKRGGIWLPYQEHVDAGRFEVKTGENDGFAFRQTRVTPKGITWLAEKYGKDDMPTVSPAVLKTSRSKSISKHSS